MNEEQMDLYNLEWEQFIHAGSEGSFTDWLIRRMDEVINAFEERLKNTSARLNVMQRTMVPQTQIEMLQRENQALSKQLEFERQNRHEPTPAVGQPRPEPWVTGTDQTVYGPSDDPRGGLDALRESRRREEIRRLAERIQALPQNRDRGQP